MTYKPVICELKCISHDIKNELNKESDSTSLVEIIKTLALTDILRFVCVAVIGAIFGLAVVWLFYSSIILSLIVILLFMLFALYVFGRYLRNVHQRCLDGLV